MGRRGKRATAERARSPGRCEACHHFQEHATAGAALHTGKQALRASHRELVEGEADCGLEFDAVFEPAHSTIHRFDYLFVRHSDCGVVAVEVHPASSTGHVKELIRKKEGTEQILAREGLGVRVQDWHWAVGGQSTIVFTSTDKYGRLLAANRIRQPRRRIQL